VPQPATELGKRAGREATESTAAGQASSHLRNDRHTRNTPVGREIQFDSPAASHAKKPGVRRCALYEAVKRSSGRRVRRRPVGLSMVCGTPVVKVYQPEHASLVDKPKGCAARVHAISDRTRYPGRTRRPRTGPVLHDGATMLGVAGDRAHRLPTHRDVEAPQSGLELLRGRSSRHRCDRHRTAAQPSDGAVLLDMACSPGWQ